MAVFVCIYLHYRTYKLNEKRDKSFEFSSILSTVDLSKHLITAWIIRKSIQLVNFVTFSVFFFFFGNRSSLVKPVLAGGNEQLPFIKTFVQEFIQCRTFLRVSYWVCIARSAFYTWLRILYPVRSPQFYTDRIQVKTSCPTHAVSIYKVNVFVPTDMLIGLVTIFPLVKKWLISIREIKQENTVADVT